MPAVSVVVDADPVAYLKQTTAGVIDVTRVAVKLPVPDATPFQATSRAHPLPTLGGVMVEPPR